MLNTDSTYAERGRLFESIEGDGRSELDTAPRPALVEELSEAFGGAKDVTPADDQPAHVLLTNLQLPSGWSPSPTQALVRFTTGWPGSRPFFYIPPHVADSNVQPPPTHERTPSHSFHVLPPHS